MNEPVPASAELATPSERRRRLRKILAGDTCVAPASVFDPLSARMAEELGYELQMLAGSVASLVVLGAPDWMLLTATEFADLAARISRASSLPLLVDADHGYGNALNVMRSVEELERAGVAGLSIEDTELPMTFGADGPPTLVSLEEGRAKLRAAVEARRDPELVLLGRTMAPAVAPFDECLERVHAYEEVGVDGLFVVGLQDRAQLEKLAGAVRLPLVVAGVREPLDTRALADCGARIVVRPHLPLQAAIAAAHDVMRLLREGVDPAELEPRVASRELVSRLTRSADYARWKSELLS